MKKGDGPMKKFENPEIIVKEFEVEDVITTSTPGGGENEGGFVPFSAVPVPKDFNIDLTDLADKL